MHLHRIFESWLKFRPAANHLRPETAFHSLPNELLLEIFSFLQLRSYIMSHAVCKKWCQLLPSTNLDPIRKRLLDLYHRILSTPNFEQAFEWTERNLQPFDREEYIQQLLSQYPVIPDEFRMWILEWPARLAIECMWPGLTLTFCFEKRPISRRSGVNWISYRSFSPRLSALIYKRNTPSQTLTPALLLWRNANDVDWLCFAQDEPDLFGRVMRFDSLDHPLGGIPYSPPRKDNESDGSGLVVFDDWIDYLEDIWDYAVIMLEAQPRILSGPDNLIPLPVGCIRDSEICQILPAPVWNSSYSQ